MQDFQYFSLNEYFRKCFGSKVYKIALEFGQSCPNRDGSLSWGGCSFCAEGSASFAATATCGIDEQIHLAKSRLSAKVTSENTKFFAYLQSYTNTYMPLERLENMLEKVLMREDILGISIGTRPDCLDEEILDLLEKWAKVKPVWVELGLQTIHDTTAIRFNRMYQSKVFFEKVKELRMRNIEIVCHLIFGLPGETVEMMLETVDAVAASGVQGVKLQVLHILKGTKMAKEYEAGEFSCLEEEEWFALLGQILPRLPRDLVIHRLTGDGPKNLLIAPLWTANKRQVRNRMYRYFLDHEIIQGSGWEEKTLP